MGDIGNSMSEVIVGIDLGTTQSAVGVVDSGFPILLADEEGHSLTPSAVWQGKNGEIEVGHSAVRRAGTQTVITSVKGLMGRRFSELQDSEKTYVTKIDTGFTVTTEGDGLTPEEASAEILRKMKQIAEARLETEVNKAVITVPAYFHDSQRAATKRAGELAGLEVVRILSEPTAAALSYGLDRLGEAAKVAVFDLGGGTFDVSLLEMRDGVFEVLSTSGDTRLGGDDFDHAISQFAAKQLDTDWETLAPLEHVRWLTEARRVKHALSSEDEVTFRIPFVGDVPMSRADFDQLLEPFLGRMEGGCRRALLDADLKEGDLKAVVMVGGSSRIPAVKERVQKIFQREPDLSQHPDEAIARGAAIQAGVLAGVVREILLLDVTPLSLGIETMGGLMNVLIPRNSTIPCKAGEMFTNAADGQESMKVRVLQGERELARDNWELGDFRVPFTPERRGQARVGVEFRIDADGLLTVLARDVATGADTLLEVGSTAVDVAEAQVEKMVSESVKFAFEDMNARVFEEAKLKANELLPAVEIALEQFQHELSQEDLQAITSARDSVTDAIKSQDATGLKNAVETLDHATEGLAALLVEKASSALFSNSQD